MPTPETIDQLPTNPTSGPPAPITGSELFPGWLPSLGRTFQYSAAQIAAFAAAYASVVPTLVAPDPDEYGITTYNVLPSDRIILLMTEGFVIVNLLDDPPLGQITIIDSNGIAGEYVATIVGPINGQLDFLFNVNYQSATFLWNGIQYNVL